MPDALAGKEKRTAPSTKTSAKIANPAANKKSRRAENSAKNSRKTKEQSTAKNRPKERHSPSLGRGLKRPPATVERPSDDFPSLSPHLSEPSLAIEPPPLPLRVIAKMPRLNVDSEIPVEIQGRIVRLSEDNDLHYNLELEKIHVLQEPGGFCHGLRTQKLAFLYHLFPQLGSHANQVRSLKVTLSCPQTGPEIQSIINISASSAN